MKARHKCDIINNSKNSDKFAFILVASSISGTLPTMIDTGRFSDVRGMATLRNELYIICRSFFCSVILVMDLRIPNSYRNLIRIKEIKFPTDMVSSEKENCLYISERIERCIWKLELDQNTFTKW